MKHTLLASSALMLLCAALPAEASSSTEWQTSTQCETILNLDVVSPYVQEVLDRADAGLTNAHAEAAQGDFRLLGAVGRVGEAWATLINSQFRLTEQAHDLMHNSACLHFDLVSIECKMDQVRNEMNAQITNGSYNAILKLESVLEFLNERYEQVVIGGLDPTYRDPTWGERRMFDTSDDTQDDILCPYNSDYGPAQQNGFGCDLTVLEPRKPFEPLRKEYDSLKVISDELESYRKAAQQFTEVQTLIDEINGVPSQTPVTPGPATHKNAFGCNWTGGLCENDPAKKCIDDTGCDEGVTCTYPTNVCKNNIAMGCINDFSCIDNTGRNNGPCIDPKSGTGTGTPARMELRGPFFVEKNHLELLIEFMAERVEQGRSRLFKDDLKTPDEFAPSQKKEKEDRASDSVNEIARQRTRSLYTTWSGLQGTREAITFPFATDPALEVANSLSSLRQAIGDLARLTKLQEGKSDTLRAFVVKLASFLRRSCIYRPCNDSLDEVLKIVFTDECFPYTDGSFLSDTKDDPRSSKCADKAKLTVP